MKTQNLERECKYEYDISVDINMDYKKCMYRYNSRNRKRECRMPCVVMFQVVCMINAVRNVMWSGIRNSHRILTILGVNG